MELHIIVALLVIAIVILVLLMHRQSLLLRYLDEQFTELAKEMFHMQARQGECLLHCRYDISSTKKNESVMEIKPK